MFNVSEKWTVLDSSCQFLRHFGFFFICSFETSCQWPKTNGWSFPLFTGGSLLRLL